MPSWPLAGSGASADLVWHGDTSVDGYDALILPGGFAHGDYLRPGAIARFSPVMEAVARFAADGGPVVGICNGFQVLTEAGLLPGALQKNRGLRFVCTTVAVRVESSDSVLTAGVPVGTELRIPINHFEGNYTCDADDPGRVAGRGPGRAPLRGQPQRLDRRHRRRVQRPAGTWSGSCPIPSGPRIRSWARSTARSCCGRCVASAGTSMTSPAVATVA